MNTLARALLPAALTLAVLAAPPLAYAQGTKTMSTSHDEAALAQRLIDLHFDIWNDTNPAHWKAKWAQVYTSDFYVADYDAKAVGEAALGKLIQKVQGEHAGFRFSPEPITWNHGIGRVTWGYGPAANPNLVRGEDIFTIRDGKLASAHVFLDKK
jgi:hypothetical protein